MRAKRQCQTHSHRTGCSSEWFFDMGKMQISLFKAIDRLCLGRLPYDKTMSYANSADICIFPSHAETFGLVLLEAMLLRKAIVCSDIDCFQEIIGDSNCVCKCRVKRIDEFAEALQRLISNPIYRCEQADRAYLNATARFNTNEIVAQNIEFYNRVIRDSSKHHVEES